MSSTIGVRHQQTQWFPPPLGRLGATPVEAGGMVQEDRLSAEVTQMASRVEGARRDFGVAFVGEVEEEEEDEEEDEEEEDEDSECEEEEESARGEFRVEGQCWRGVGDKRTPRVCRDEGSGVKGAMDKGCGGAREANLPGRRPRRPCSTLVLDPVRCDLMRTLSSPSGTGGGRPLGAGEKTSAPSGRSTPPPLADIDEKPRPLPPLHSQQRARPVAIVDPTCEGPRRRLSAPATVIGSSPPPPPGGPLLAGAPLRHRRCSCHGAGAVGARSPRPAIDPPNLPPRRHGGGAWASRDVTTTSHPDVEVLVVVEEEARRRVTAAGEGGGGGVRERKDAEGGVGGARVSLLEEVGGGGKEVVAEGRKGAKKRRRRQEEGDEDEEEEVVEEDVEEETAAAGGRRSHHHPTTAGDLEGRQIRTVERKNHRKRSCSSSTTASSSAVSTSSASASSTQRRRHKHRKRRRRRSRAAESDEDEAGASDAGVHPTPRVNPIFVWAKQDDAATILEVLCEDYDKRNRIRLTKTPNGWRAIPRTERFAAATANPTPTTAATEPPPDTVAGQPSPKAAAPGAAAPQDPPSVVVEGPPDPSVLLRLPMATTVKTPARRKSRSSTHEEKTTKGTAKKVVPSDDGPRDEVKPREGLDSPGQPETYGGEGPGRPDPAARAKGSAEASELEENPDVKATSKPGPIKSRDQRLAGKKGKRAPVKRSRPRSRKPAVRKVAAIPVLPTQKEEDEDEEKEVASEAKQNESGKNCKKAAGLEAQPPQPPTREISRGGAKGRRKAARVTRSSARSRIARTNKNSAQRSTKSASIKSRSPAGTGDAIKESLAEEGEEEAVDKKEKTEGRKGEEDNEAEEKEKVKEETLEVRGEKEVGEASVEQQIKEEGEVEGGEEGVEEKVKEDKEEGENREEAEKDKGEIPDDSCYDLDDLTVEKQIPEGDDEEEENDPAEVRFEEGEEVTEADTKELEAEAVEEDTAMEEGIGVEMEVTKEGLMEGENTESEQPQECMEEDVEDAESVNETDGIAETEITSTGVTEEEELIEGSEAVAMEGGMTGDFVEEAEDEGAVGEELEEGAVMELEGEGVEMLAVEDGETAVAEDDGEIEEEGAIVDEEGEAVEDEGATIEDEAGTAVEEAGTVVDEAGTVVDEAGTVVDEAGTVVDDVGTVVDEAGTVEGEAGIMERETVAVEEEPGTFEEEGATVEEDVNPAEDEAVTTEEEAGIVDEEAAIVEDESGSVDDETAAIEEGMAPEGALAASEGEVEGPEGESTEAEEVVPEQEEVEERATAIVEEEAEEAVEEEEGDEEEDEEEEDEDEEEEEEDDEEEEESPPKTPPPAHAASIPSLIHQPQPSLSVASVDDGQEEPADLTTPKRTGDEVDELPPFKKIRRGHVTALPPSTRITTCPRSMLPTKELRVPKVDGSVPLPAHSVEPVTFPIPQPNTEERAIETKTPQKDPLDLVFPASEGPQINEQEKNNSKEQWRNVSSSVSSSRKSKESKVEASDDCGENLLVEPPIKKIKLEVVEEEDAATDLIEPNTPAEDSHQITLKKLLSCSKDANPNIGLASSVGIVVPKPKVEIAFPTEINEGVGKSFSRSRLLELLTSPDAQKASPPPNRSTPIQRTPSPASSIPNTVSTPQPQLSVKIEPRSEENEGGCEDAKSGLELRRLKDLLGRRSAAKLALKPISIENPTSLALKHIANSSETTLTRLPTPETQQPVSLSMQRSPSVSSSSSSSSRTEPVRVPHPAARCHKQSKNSSPSAFPINQSLTRRSTGREVNASPRIDSSLGPESDAATAAAAATLHNMLWLPYLGQLEMAVNTGNRELLASLGNAMFGPPPPVSPSSQSATSPRALSHFPTPPPPQNPPFVHGSPFLQPSSLPPSAIADYKSRVELSQTLNLWQDIMAANASTTFNSMHQEMLGQEQLERNGGANGIIGCQRQETNASSHQQERQSPRFPHNGRKPSPVSTPLSPAHSPSSDFFRYINAGAFPTSGVRGSRTQQLLQNNVNNNNNNYGIRYNGGHSNSAVHHSNKHSFHEQKAPNARQPTPTQIYRNIEASSTQLQQTLSQAALSRPRKSPSNSLTSNLDQNKNSVRRQPVSSPSREPMKVPVSSPMVTSSSRQKPTVTCRSLLNLLSNPRPDGTLDSMPLDNGMDEPLAGSRSDQQHQHGHLLAALARPSANQPEKRTIVDNSRAPPVQSVLRPYVIGVDPESECLQSNRYPAPLSGVPQSLLPAGVVAQPMDLSGRSGGRSSKRDARVMESFRTQEVAATLSTAGGSPHPHLWHPLFGRRPVTPGAGGQSQSMETDSEADESCYYLDEEQGASASGDLGKPITYCSLTMTADVWQTYPLSSDALCLKLGQNVSTTYSKV